ncbi:hypothetical protein Y1Q_0010192 [Alligator mississippiensis]|uniref:Uncharacterized protein n=1 Tax=Alligator mississippiensis TaxID=8496 RepID=A0A151NG12_ALLMI|nr:hypothetical protein Y1Q_0010192 [Alligator mississippiensis]
MEIVKNPLCLLLPGGFCALSGQTECITATTYPGVDEDFIGIFCKNKGISFLFQQISNSVQLKMKDAGQRKARALGYPISKVAATAFYSTMENITLVSTHCSVSQDPSWE